MAEKKKKPTVFISQDDQYLFAQGTHYDIYEKLGAHPSCEDGEEGMFFAVWAPNAKNIPSSPSSQEGCAPSFS